MKPKEFIGKLDEQRIVRAIAEAERKSSGEIRVYVSHQARPNIMAAAEHQFRKLGMIRTRKRNGVLIYFAPLLQQFAIFGDVGIHQRCGQDLWDKVSVTMTEQLKHSNFTEAIVSGIERVGAALAEQFPPDPADRNELPDQIAGD